MRVLRHRNIMRQRGTAVVIRHGKVLLVRDKGENKFSLPGGGIEKRELAVCTAARELFEELGIHVLVISECQNAILGVH